MNRRKAIRNLLLGTGVATVAVSGYKWYAITKRPHLAELDQYKALISEIAETIIPETDTPGAKNAHVGEFIYKMIIDCADVKSQNRFLYGLKDLESHCHSKFGHSFIHCTVSQREETLRYIEQSDKPYAGVIGKIQRKLFGTSFFEMFKNYTVMGYCTSMEGATKGLAYDLVPGTYEACIPIKPGQRSWATK